MEPLFGDAPCSVGDFVAAAKGRIEESLSPGWVVGEVANFTRAASGHWYFVLRDSQAQVDCVMLARDNRAVGFSPADGDRVVLYGHPTLYAPRGRFQLAARFLQADGVGRLHQLFARRKREWHARGWFARARRLPMLPRCVGVVCSPSGAAVRDVLRTLRARAPSVAVIIYPAPAQGRDAAEKIAAAIDIAGRRQECDVLLVCRGGGGIEDLWAFNEEPVIVAIVNSPLPVATGIGHETDETLADYAADCRAATPTGAAVAVAPDAAQLASRVDDCRQRLWRRLMVVLDEMAQRLDWAVKFIAAPEKLLAEKKARLSRLLSMLLLAASRRRLEMAERLATRLARLRLPDASLSLQKLGDLESRMPRAAETFWRRADDLLRARHRALELLSPRAALKRGYSIVYNGDAGIVTDAACLSKGGAVEIVFYRGVAKAVVSGTRAEEDGDNGDK